MSSASKPGHRVLPEAWSPTRFGGWLERLGARRIWSYELGVFLAAMAVFSLAVPFSGFDGIIGDNICQVGYWRVLQHPSLIGSLGAASMKPALILLLGPVHDLSLALLGSTALIKTVFSLAGSALTTIVARIAKERAGPIAGIGAAVYLVTRTPVQEMFTRGTSMIVFLPLLLIGVWLFSREQQLAGAVVLCVAALVRIESFAVLLWLAISEQLLRKNWRAFIITSLLAGATLVFTVIIYYRLQGSVARFNAGNPPAGYLYTREPSLLLRFTASLEYAWSSTTNMLLTRCGSPYLAAAALSGCVLASARRFYASLLGIPLFLIVYLSAGQGSSESRYFSFIPPMVAAFGAVGITQAMRFGREVGHKPMFWLLLAGALPGVVCFVVGGPPVLCSLSLLLIAAETASALERLPFTLPVWLTRSAWVLLFAAVFVTTALSGEWRPRAPAQYTQDAKALVEHKLLPRGKRVLMDDDILYGVLVRDHRLLERAGTLQYFNVQDDAHREEILASTDYLVLSTGSHFFYYLKYDPLARGTSDPFRAAVQHARRNKPASVYGYRLVPFSERGRLFVLKVEKA
jgi:hypothetical protein